MPKNATMEFKNRISAGEVLWGTMVTLPCPAIAEILVDAGFDWLFIDGEHGELESDSIAQILRTVGERIPCLVRVPEASAVSIKKVLDLGAHGIIVPQVNDAQTAADVVRWSKYPPLGERGVGLARAHGYGSRFQEYVDNANDSLSVIVQIEDKLAVENVDEIIATEGVDAAFLGPYDLSASMGMMGEVASSDVQVAIDKTCRACKATGIAIGSFGVTADALKRDIERGVTLVCAGTDTIFLSRGANEMLARLNSSNDQQSI